MTKAYTGPLITAEHAYRDYAISVDAGITLRDLLKPEAWSRNVDGQLRPGDRVRAIAKDGSYDCLLVCRAVLVGAGLIMEIDDSGVPGSPTRKRLEAIAAEVGEEAATARRARLDAALQGEHP
jgi:hypothetical protein